LLLAADPGGVGNYRQTKRWATKASRSPRVTRNNAVPETQVSVFNGVGKRSWGEMQKRGREEKGGKNPPVSGGGKGAGKESTFDGVRKKEAFPTREDLGEKGWGGQFAQL